MDDKSARDWATKKLEDPNAVTDGGCTFAPDFNFTECCKKHDVMINYNQGISNKQADRLLRECIISAGHPNIAWIYWVWVRFSSMVGGAKNAVALSIIIPALIAVFILLRREL